VIKMRSSLAILVLLALVLAVIAIRVGSAVDGNPTKLRGNGATPSAGAAIDPDVALRILGPEPSRVVSLLSGVDTARVPPAVSSAVRRERAAIGRAGVDLERDLLARLSFLVISLERSCPPPAILACRPAIRILGRLRDRPDRDLERNLRTTVSAGLDAAGFRSVTAHSSRRGDQLRGRATARSETLVRWRVSNGVLEVATGGLGLRGREELPDASSEPEVKLAINPPTLESLVSNSSSSGDF
jgi:hypothetical protein